MTIWGEVSKLCRAVTPHILGLEPQGDASYKLESNTQRNFEIISQEAQTSQN